MRMAASSASVIRNDGGGVKWQIGADCAGKGRPPA